MCRSGHPDSGIVRRPGKLISGLEAVDRRPYKILRWAYMASGISDTRQGSENRASYGNSYAIDADEIGANRSSFPDKADPHSLQ